MVGLFRSVIMYSRMSLIQTSDIRKCQSDSTVYVGRKKKLMDKYLIVFRWLAQVGGASSCMFSTETTLAAALKTLEQLQYNNYTHCVPAVFLVLLISFKINNFSYPEY